MVVVPRWWKGLEGREVALDALLIEFRAVVLSQLEYDLGGPLSSTNIPVDGLLHTGNIEKGTSTIVALKAHSASKVGCTVVGCPLDEHDVHVTIVIEKRRRTAIDLRDCRSY